MDASVYQLLAMRTNDSGCSMRLLQWSGNNDFSCSDGGGIINACLGLSGEVGELNDLIKKWIFHGTPLDIVHVKKELGDVCWYVALMCESFGLELNDVMNTNIEKLKQRYPDGFDIVRANNRKEGDI